MCNFQVEAAPYRFLLTAFMDKKFPLLINIKSGHVSLVLSNERTRGPVTGMSLVLTKTADFYVLPLITSRLFLSTLLISVCVIHLLTIQEGQGYSKGEYCPFQEKSWSWKLHNSVPKPHKCNNDSWEAHRLD